VSGKRAAVQTEAHDFRERLEVLDEADDQYADELTKLESEIADLTKQQADLLEPIGDLPKELKAIAAAPVSGVDDFIKLRMSGSATYEEREAYFKQLLVGITSFWEIMVKGPGVCSAAAGGTLPANATNAAASGGSADGGTPPTPTPKASSYGPTHRQLEATSL
jgi:hypothetical protein